MHYPSLDLRHTFVAGLRGPESVFHTNYGADVSSEKTELYKFKYLRVGSIHLTEMDHLSFQ